MSVVPVVRRSSCCSLWDTGRGWVSSPSWGQNVFMQPAAEPTIELGRSSSSFSKAWGCQDACGVSAAGTLPPPQSYL